MTKQPKLKSDAYEAIHSSASGMFRIGTIDKATMRCFDEHCLMQPSSDGQVLHGASLPTPRTDEQGL